MGVRFQRCGAVIVAVAAILTACGESEAPEVERVIEYSCDGPNAPADVLFARGEEPDTEIRWGGGEWHSVTAGQYDDAVVRLCYR